MSSSNNTETSRRSVAAAPSAAGGSFAGGETSATALRFNFRRPAGEGALAQQPRRRPRSSAQRWKLVWFKSEGCVDVVGESNYQSALKEITGRRDWVEVSHNCAAVLVLEPTNPHDPNAVRVEIKGQLVGYLSRADAVSYGPYLRELARRRQLPCCQAFISGRGRGADTRNMGVFLRMIEPGPELLATCTPIGASINSHQRTRPATSARGR